MDILVPKSKPLENAFVTPNHNGLLYNTEQDKPIKDRAAESLQLVGNEYKVTTIDSQRLQHAKLGDKVKYFGGDGTIVAREGYNLKVYNEESNVVEFVPISATIFQNEVIDNVENLMWDKMQYDIRMATLNKAQISKPQIFAKRSWHELPRELQTVIKEQSNAWSEASRGGFAGREPGITRDSESQSYKDRIYPEHVTKPYEDPQADALKTDIKQNPEGIVGEDEDGKVSATKTQNMAAIVGDNDREGHKEHRDSEKSDEERGMYGGISTEMEPLDATNDYEERPKQIPNVGQKEIDSAPTGQTSTRESKDPRNERDQIGYNQKACSICGEDHEDKDHVNKEGLTTASVGINNPIYGNDKKRKAIKLRNKHSTRYGVRYDVTPEEFEESRSDFRYHSK